ncbi:MAG: MXAN_6577-like cysteine-rich protein, partial [Polyangiales bacterium]
MRSRWHWLVLPLGALAACSDGATPTPPRPDATPDLTSPDVADEQPAPDVGQDLAPPDVAPDAAPDASEDVAPDATPDAPEDVAPDAPADMGPMCMSGMALCEGACVDTQTSSMHCGMCGRACPMAQSCVMGACVDPPCPTGQTRCGGACVDAQTDVANCGTCGNACPMGQVCTAGACADPPCPMGQTRCAGACVDTGSSNANCGMCGRACSAREMCSMGACASTCAAGTTDCGTTCNNLQTEVGNCGMCGRSCATPAGASPTCTAGACGFTCMTGLGNCDGNADNGCETDTRTTPAHCGGCGMACAAGQLCVAGSCADPPCPTGQTRCAGACVDTATAVAHCGMCGRACPSGTGGAAACVAGACQLACTAGLGDCDGMSANGCEVNVATSAMHCGACGRACGSGQTCTAGRCEATACAPAAGCTGASCQTCGRVAFGEDWESGIAAWALLNGGSAPITTATDSSDCRGRYLRETERFSAGRVFTRSAIPVTGGRAYCISSWIRGSAGTWPFVGIRESNASAVVGAEHWLIGQPCFSNGFGGSVAPVTSDGQWRWYAREFTAPAATTHVLIELEIWDGGAVGTADFDQVQLLEGPCPQLPPATVCTPATCTACPAGQVPCGTTCVDLTTSDANCGACGRACASGERCIAGACGNDVTGNGSSGALAVSTGTTTINTIRSAATGAMGATSLDLSTPAGFAAGQFLFLHQSQGAGVGAWEIAEVTAVAGSRLTLRNPLANAYNSAGTNRAQAVVMPQYTTVNVTGGAVTAPAWDGNTGGVLAFLATGAVTVSGGAIDMSSRGYRGTARGTAMNIPGFQGEGSVGVAARATAANGNGGGGGARTDCDCCWAGAGGGGGHGTAGTGGSAGGATCQAGGVGGLAVGTPAQTSIFFGGAGASGGADEDGVGSAGANGGGIVYIAALSINVTSGAVVSDGQAGQPEFNFSGCGSGGGGGGAGGAIYLRAGSVALGSSRVLSRGGTGGDDGGNCGTPGGTGSVGRVTVRTAGTVSGAS